MRISRLEPLLSNRERAHVHRSLRAAKRQAKTVALGTLVLAVQFLDLLWPTFLLLNREEVHIVPGITAVKPFDFTSYPYSHSQQTVGVAAQS